jgi:hypothetical protein
MSNAKHLHARKSGKTPTYNSWMKMRSRCNNPASNRFHAYGGRGIKVCARWDTFANFLFDMGERPVGTTIGRINPDANYEPANCRWETSKQQARQNSRNVMFTFDGRTMCLTDWANKVGLKVHTLYYRLVVAKWPVEDAIAAPLNTRRPGQKSAPASSDASSP